MPAGSGGNSVRCLPYEELPQSEAGLQAQRCHGARHRLILGEMIRSQCRR